MEKAQYPGGDCWNPAMIFMGFIAKTPARWRMSLDFQRPQSLMIEGDQGVTECLSIEFIFHDRPTGRSHRAYGTAARIPRPVDPVRAAGGGG